MAASHDEAVEAAAALAAALQGGSTGAPALRSGLLPASFVSLSVPVGDGSTLCSSGNLLGGGATQSSLFVADSTAAGLVLRSGGAKLMRLAPLGRCSLTDVCCIMSASQARLAAIALLPFRTPDGGMLGVLSVGYSSDADVSAASLKRALLVAHALGQRHEEAVGAFASLVSSMLLPRQHSPPRTASASGWDSDAGSEGSSCWDLSDLEDDSEDEGEDWGGPAAAPPGQEQQGPESGLGGAASCILNPLTLRFHKVSYEQAFSAFHAAHHQPLDALAYACCCFFLCVGALFPSSTQMAAPHLGAWLLPLGCAALLPGLLLLTARSRSWFARHRDWMLLATWIAATAWLLVLRRARGASAGCNVSATLTLLGCAFPLRFRFLAPLMLALHSQVLPQTGLSGLLCGVVLPLSVAYRFESGIRRAFLETAAA